MTWYTSVEQTPNPVLVGADLAPDSQPITVDYKEGAEIGYRWMSKTGQVPTYSFWTWLKLHQLHLFGF